MRYIEEVNDFGNVRSLIQQGPAAWSELTLYLERWLDRTSFLDMVAPYVSSHINAWPRGAASAPGRWKRWLLLGHEVLPMHCLRSLSLANMWRHIDHQLWKQECLQHMEYLDLSHTKVSVDSLKYLLGGADRFEKLRGLALCGNPQLIPQKGTMGFFDQPRMAQVRVLALKRCEISYRSMSFLTRNEKLENLEMLKLSGNDLTDTGVRDLASSRMLPALSSLDLKDVIMTQRGVRDLSRAHFLPQLVWLSFSVRANAAPGKSALLGFLSNPALAKLGALTLSAPWIDDDIAAHIAKQPHFAGLNTLVLQHSFDEAMLSQFADHSRVDALDLPNLSKRGVDALVQSPHLSEKVRAHWQLILEPAS